MFIRKKKRQNGKISVQIVENVRLGKSTQQKVIKHVGTCDDNEQDLEQVIKLALWQKNKLEEELAPSLFDSSEADKIKETHINAAYKEAANSNKNSKQREGVNIYDLEEDQRNIIGFHDVYGSLFDDLGFNNIFAGGVVRNKSVSRVLKDTVIARIANPSSKRSSVSMLEEEFGVNIDLDKVYRMMDKIDDDTIDKIKLTSLNAAKSLFNDKIDVIFYDATTLYFESFDEDELRQKGYSKDMKFNQTQIMLTIYATKEGIPIGYDIFEGSFYEGHSLTTALDNIKKNYNLDKIVFVADSGMLNKDNLKLLDDNGYSYIIGARERNSKKTIQEKILKLEDYNQISDDFKALRIDLNEEKNKNKDVSKSNSKNNSNSNNGSNNINENNKKITNQILISCYSSKRAYKDKKDRETAILKLQKKLAKSKDVKSLISNYGYEKYLNIDTNNAKNISLNTEKLKTEEKWDGIFTITTNDKDLSSLEILNQYKSLWQIEETFRISKHNLKFRPIYHFKKERVKAHMAICYISLTLVRNLMYKAKILYKNLPPIQINNALKKAQISILRDKSNNKQYALPAKINQDTKRLYQLVNQKYYRGVVAL